MGVFEVFLMTIFIINIVIIISMHFIDKYNFKKMSSYFLGLIFIIWSCYLCNFLYEKYLLITNPFKTVLDILIIFICLIEVVEQITRFIKSKIKK